jgi:hypothetical protein
MTIAGPDYVHSSRIQAGPPCRLGPRGHGGHPARQGGRP